MCQNNRITDGWSPSENTNIIVATMINIGGWYPTENINIIVVTMINFGGRENPLLCKFSFERPKAVNRIGNQITVNSIAPKSTNLLFNFCPRNAPASSLLFLVLQGVKSSQKKSSFYWGEATFHRFKQKHFRKSLKFRVELIFSDQNPNKVKSQSELQIEFDTISKIEKSIRDSRTLE